MIVQTLSKIARFLSIELIRAMVSKKQFYIKLAKE